MKVFLKIGIALLIAGFVIAVLGLVLGASWKGLYLSRTGVNVIESEQFNVSEMYQSTVKNIDINIQFSDVEFVNADEFGMEILAYNEDNWSWELNNGALRIREGNRQGFSIGILNTQRSYVKVFVPRGAQLDKVTVRTSSGDIKMGDFSANFVDINDDFGNVNISSIASDALTVSLSSGRFGGVGLNVKTFTYRNSFGNGIFQDVQAGKLMITCDSGDLELSRCGFGELKITNSFGNITAAGLNSLKTNITSNSGEVNLEGEFSGETVIDSQFGNVKFSTSKPKEAYTYTIETSFGNVRIDNERFRDNTSVRSSGSSENSLRIEASSGDIEVYFGR